MLLEPSLSFMTTSMHSGHSAIMADPDVSQVLERLEALAANPPTDPKLRKRVYDIAQKLALAVEPSYDTIYRVIYSVSRATWSPREVSTSY